jgi:integrase
MILALAGCATVAAGSGQAPNAPDQQSEPRDTSGMLSETTTLRRYKTYRDGLIIGLLASRQLRLSNIAGLTLKRTIVQRGDAWWIQIPATETKTRDPIEAPWPEMLVPYLQTYLADHRAGIAALRGSRIDASRDALWLSMYGLPMTDNGIYDCVVAHTAEELGQPINPHLFRDCAVTSLAVDDPGNIGIASRLLDHRTGSTAERYYNQAGGVEASRLMQDYLLALRHDNRSAVDLKDRIP